MIELITAGLIASSAVPATDSMRVTLHVAGSTLLAKDKPTTIGLSVTAGTNLLFPAGLKGGWDAGLMYSNGQIYPKASIALGLPLKLYPFGVSLIAGAQTNSAFNSYSVSTLLSPSISMGQVRLSVSVGPSFSLTGGGTGLVVGLRASTTF